MACGATFTKFQLKPYPQGCIRPFLHELCTVCNPTEHVVGGRDSFFVVADRVPTIIIGGFS